MSYHDKLVNRMNFSSDGEVNEQRINDYTFRIQVLGFANGARICLSALKRPDFITLGCEGYSYGKKDEMTHYTS